MKDKYKFQRIMNRIKDFLWTTIVRIIVIALLITVFILCLPWLKSLWNTIAY